MFRSFNHGFRFIMTRVGGNTWCSTATTGTVPLSRKIYVTAIIVRIALVIYSVIHDHLFRVKYTDIDYMIVVDGARSIVAGRCPFERATYRYTPLLGVLMIPSVLIHDVVGKLVFAASDIITMYLCDTVLQRRSTVRSKKILLMLFIAFNPIVLNVSTRGNSDMLITLLTVWALSLLEIRSYAAAATILGFATHFKIYPLIYVPAFVFGVYELEKTGSVIQRLVKTVGVAVLCGLLFVVGFAVPTATCYKFCGETYMYEAFYYHLEREDHRHNFSPYWMLMYLNMAGRSMNFQRDFAPGLGAFIPQAIALLLAAYLLRRNVAQACAVMTVLFVAFNKVCTVQYFVWFIPLLPFIFCEPITERAALKATSSRPELLKWRYKRPSAFVVITAMLLWVGTIPLWVMAAFPLEFEGQNHFGRVWVASCMFFLATVLLGGWLGRVCYYTQMQVASDEEVLHRLEGKRA